MKKNNSKKILFIAGMMIFSAVAYGKDVFANYGTNFGKVRLSQLSSQNMEDVKRVDASTYELTGSGEYRIMEEGGRRLVVNLNNGILNGKYDEYYANGNRFTLGNYVNGKKEGEWTVYTENEKVWKKYQYKNDQLDGRYTSYYAKTGAQETVGNYENGKMTGTWTEYYENGSRKSQGNYSDGQKNGLFTEWNTSGGKKSEINYVNDEVNGKMNVYYENGRPLYEANLDGETGTVKGYYTNGSLGFDGSFRGRRRTGTWTYYDKAGNPRKVSY